MTRSYKGGNITNMTRATKIESNKWYTLQDIVRDGMFPWVSSFQSVRKAVASDINGKNILKANVAGTGRGRKYHFKGENIISFIKAMEGGKVTL